VKWVWIKGGVCMMDKCALCGQIKELKLSHIIPKFVFDYIKRTGAIQNTRFRRPLDNPNIPYQDGDKQELLCGECEELFCAKEKLFAEQVFIPFQNNAIVKNLQYGPWLHYFITSVNWRNLYLDILDFERNGGIRPHALDALRAAEKKMREYLICRTENIAGIENHIFFADAIKKADSKIAELGPHMFIRRSAFGYSYMCYNPDAYYVYSNLAGVIIATIIKKHPQEVWSNTRVKPNEGIITIPQSVKSPLIGELFDYMRDSHESTISDSQQQKLVERLKKDPQRLINSEFYKCFMLDAELKKRYIINPD